MTDDAEAEVRSTPQDDHAEPDPSPQQRRPTPALAASVAIAVVAVDQLTKRWALSELTASGPRHVIWTLQWNLTRNSGMAFSRAQGIGPFIGIAALLVVV